jgi:hydroxyacylglutathione hydrolase
MPVAPIACLADNYAYAVFSEGNASAVVVDPSEAAPIVAWLQTHGLRLEGLLLTHHHWDHVGGVPELRERFGPLRIVAHATDAARIKGVTEHVADGQHFEIASLAFEVLHVPGHTLGAVAYRWNNALFTGDTLFGAGCGRLFEGTAPQLYASLSKLAALPPETEVYCGHEYTARNLAFASMLEPNNAHIQARLERVQTLRAAGQPSVPSTLAEELATNPFLRCDDALFQRRVHPDHTVQAAALFAEIRQRRNGF